MTKPNLNTALHKKLLDLSETSSGFSASELTGYSPEQVRRGAEALVKAGDLVRHNVSPRRVRYFSNMKAAKQYTVGQNRATHMAAGSRAKAPWKLDEPAIITSKTKIYIAPPLPRNVYRTNTYLQL